MKVKHNHVVIDGGTEYREIAEIMTAAGYEMNHTSARNHVLRFMKRLASSYSNAWGIPLSDDRLEGLIRSPHFQDSVYELMGMIEDEQQRFRDEKKGTA